MKICTSCKEQKPISEYSPSKRGGMGVQAKCKPCYAEIMRKRRTIDPTYSRNYAKTYVQKNYALVLEKTRIYRLNNPEKVAVWKKKDRTDNKVRISADCAMRRAKITTPITFEIKQLYALRDFYKAMSLGDEFHVDHIVPLAKNGQHIYSNLQVIPAICNLRKGAK